jgi:hypothetical protein
MAAAKFLLLSLGESARIGGTVRVVAGAASEDEAKTKLDALDPAVLGHIAIVEVKQHFERRPTVQNFPSTSPLFDTER